MTVLLGIEFAVPLALLALLRLVTAESWRTTLITTVLASATVCLVFHTLRGVPLQGAMLLSY